MNVKSVCNVTNLTNKLSFAALAALLTVLPQVAMAQLTPSLSKLAKIVVVEPSVSDAAIATDCRIDVKAIQNSIIALAAAEKLPVITAANSAEMMRTDIFRATLKPEIATLRDGVVNCVSWVSLRVEGQYTLALAPVTDMKNITVTFWQRGGLIMTPVIDHDKGVGNGFSILVKALAKQYALDNPALLPSQTNNGANLEGLKPQGVPSYPTNTVPTFPPPVK